MIFLKFGCINLMKCFWFLRKRKMLVQSKEGNCVLVWAGWAMLFIETVSYKCVEIKRDNSISLRLASQKLLCTICSVL